MAPSIRPESAFGIPMNGGSESVGDRIRQVRTMMRMTLKDVANATGYSISYLSQVERSLTSPSIAALKKISDALKVQAAAFMFESQDWTPNRSLTGTAAPTASPSRPPVRIVRADRRKSIRFPESEIQYELLVPDLQGQSAVVTFRAPPGTESGEDPFFHAGEDVGYVLEGCLELIVDGELHELSTGDSFQLNSTVFHKWRNPGPKELLMLWVMTPPSF